MDEVLARLQTAVLEGNARIAADEVRQGVESGMDPATILNQGMVAAMAEVGRRFENGDYFVPEMLIAARAMQSGLAVLKPQLVKAKVASAGRVVIGTVKGDLHDIGKNLVSLMLEGVAFEIVDLGTDVSPEKFIEAIRNTGAQIVAMSALLTTTMPQMKRTVEALEAAGVRPGVKVMIGGAPVTEAYAREIGADGYAADASKAVTLARTLLAELQQEAD